MEIQAIGSRTKCCLYKKFHQNQFSFTGKSNRHAIERLNFIPSVVSATASEISSLEETQFDYTAGSLQNFAQYTISGVEDYAPFCNILDKPNKKQVCLFYCKEMENLAKAVASGTEDIELRPIEWGKFPDGFPNLFVPNAKSVRGRHVAFLASFSSPAVIFEQLSVIYALPRLFVSSFTLVLPFFPSGTAEQTEDEGDIATASTLARVISNIPISRGGPTSLVTFDIHALQERFYFSDDVLPCFGSAMAILKRRILALPASHNISIAFPDEGSFKRFHREFSHYPLVVCTKTREGENHIFKIKEGDPRGRHVVIVDDLVKSGSTLRECQKVLKKSGASMVSAFATHAIFPEDSWKSFVHDQTNEEEATNLEYFWITDSCPLVSQKVENVRPFEVLSISTLIQDALQV